MLSGSSRLSEGEARIDLPEELSRAITSAEPPRVSVTPTAECNGLCVTQRASGGFTVKELMSGHSAATFDWFLIARLSDALPLRPLPARFGIKPESRH